MSQIPAFFTTSIITTAALFALVTWFLIHQAIKKTTAKSKHLKYSAVVFFSLALWFVAVYFLSKASIFAQNPLVAPFLAIGFILIFAILQKVYASKTAQFIMAAVPQHWLIAIQTYRVVGYGFLILASLGFLPWLFAYSAGYGDIIVGVSAPLVAFLYYYTRGGPLATKTAIIWNYLGILDLIMAYVIGSLGFPRPIQTLPLSPTTEQLSLFPLALIPLFAVPIAIMLHLFSLKTLKRQ